MVVEPTYLRNSQIEDLPPKGVNILKMKPPPRLWHRNIMVKGCEKRIQKTNTSPIKVGHSRLLFLMAVQAWSTWNGYNSPNWTNNHPVTPIDTPQDPQVIYGSGSDHIFEDIIPSSLGTQKAKAWEGLKSKAWRLSKPTPFLGEAEMISLHHEQPPRAAWNPGENLSAAGSLFSVGGEIDSFVLAWDAVRWLTPKWYDLLHLLGVLQT